MAGFADIRRQARRDIHTAFAVSAIYSDPFTLKTDLMVRWHDRFVAPVGNLSGGDYAEILENIDKVVFDADELVDKGVVPIRNGEVKLTDYNGYVLVLDVREPADGPLKVTWTVTRPPKQSIDM